MVYNDDNLLKSLSWMVPSNSMGVMYLFIFASYLIRCIFREIISDFDMFFSMDFKIGGQLHGWLGSNE